MKKFFKTMIAGICMLIMSIAILPTTAYARNPLDEIQDYVIQIGMREDGTMDIFYHIEWMVLDSTSEGPLEWVKVGCPNMHVDEITAKSENIKEIGYYADNGSYIRIDFDRQYEAGETIKFDYSIHQSYMYVIEEDNHLCRYSFTPGWFDDIDVKRIRIEWEDRNVIESNAKQNDDGYLVWEDELPAGKRLNASVKYNLDVFDTNPDEQYTEDYGKNTTKSGNGDEGLSTGAIILIVIVVIVIIAIIIAIFCDDDYHGGFGGGSHTYIHTHSSCVRSSCVCASHCACACACAGGGRAGCSTKDFYKYPNANELVEVLGEDLYSEDK